MLITDNIGREDLIIIDRQVMDTKHRKKMDLLALDQNNMGDYQFCVIEVKLGNNPELGGKVAQQLKYYKEEMISKNFLDYKKCYERNLKQKQELGLIKKDLQINIIEGVCGVVVVGGYSGIAKTNISKLKKQHPEIRVMLLSNIMEKVN